MSEITIKPVAEPVVMPVPTAKSRAVAASGTGAPSIFSGTESKTKPETLPAEPEFSEHTVKKGDTLTKIAARHGIELKELMRANGLNKKSADKLQIGQKLLIPIKPKAQNTTQTINSASSDKNFQQALSFVLKKEGGYNPNDKGGGSNKGIRQDIYHAYLRKNGKEIKPITQITDKEVEEIYYKEYFKASGADKIKDPKLALAVFDTSVNMGVSVGKAILKASNGDFNKFLELRIEKYKSIVKANPAHAKYLNGWIARVNSLRDF
ncbi:MAG: glycosyl hydrolase 108 family protein [Candidatus Gastranaerophilales bacterium]|nr:glycosyl hydrolase 108 family protein [Candidatus Gastranaerophilales bacterium]